jgi:hypothetical protein
MVLLYLNLYVNPKWVSQDLEGLFKEYVFLSKVNTLNETNVNKLAYIYLSQGEALGSHMVG